MLSAVSRGCGGRMQKKKKGEGPEGIDTPRFFKESWQS
jgi:hypothetical protein